MDPDDLTPPTGEPEHGPTIRAIEARVAEIDETERSIIHVINTDGLDRYNTVIDPGGGDFADYLRNPIVLWCHDTDRLPVGRNAWVKKQKAKGRILAKTIFDTDEFSESVFEKYRSGSMSAWSIRFDPIYKYCSGPTPDEIKARPELAECYLVYRKWKLLEYSAVTVPGNADCLNEGRTLKPEIKEALSRVYVIGEPKPTRQEPPEPEPETPQLPSIRGAITYHQYLAATIEAARSHNLRARAAALTQETLDRVRGRI